MATSHEYGGYEYSFVNIPPGGVTCGICHLPSKVPYQSVCCGRVFCKSCLDTWKAKQPKNSYHCPTCRSRGYKVVVDKRSDREVRGLQIYCSNKRKGCEWQGEINDITDHLCKTCGFEDVKCTNDCGETIQRQYIVEHTTTVCLFRQVTCQYCHITGKYHFVEGEHKQQCPKFPLTCQNKCDIKTVCREDMEVHRKTCPNEMIKCEYNYIGCKTEMLRRDQSSHNKTKEKYHLNLRLTATELKLASAEEKLAYTESRISSLDRKVSNLEVMVCELMGNSSSKKAPIDRQGANWNIYLTATALESKVCPVILKLPEFAKTKYWASSKIWCTSWFSEPFFSHYNRYKICLCVDAFGSGNGKGTHMSIAMHTMKGSDDGKLKWPMRKIMFEITLLNQQNDRNHHSVIANFDNIAVSSSIGSRVTQGEISKDGWVCEKFITNDKLNKITPTCQFIKNDCVFFQVAAVDNFDK